MRAARMALPILCMGVACCGRSTHPVPVIETFAGTVMDAPNVAGRSYDVSVGAAGTLSATLTWMPQPPAQPAGQAVLAMALRDRAGAVVFDSYGMGSGGSPTRASAQVRQERYTLTVRPQFRERIGFYCLCDVPFTVVVEHP